MGQMIGMAVRSKIAVRLDFAPVVWKILVGQALVYQDLEHFDKAICSTIDDIGRLCERILSVAPAQVLSSASPPRPYSSGRSGTIRATVFSNGKLSSSYCTAAANSAASVARILDSLGGENISEIFASSVAELENVVEELRWMTHLSDGTAVDLVPGGSLMPVHISDLARYIDVLVHARLHESDRGRFSVIYVNCFMCFLSSVLFFSPLRCARWIGVRNSCVCFTVFFVERIGASGLWTAWNRYRLIASQYRI